MNPVKLETCIRTAVVVFTAALGLFASTPNVHGTADTRGGAPCDVNKTLNSPCGDASYQSACLYTYTRCYAVAGWRFMTCTPKPLASNGCARDFRCFPRDDWSTSGLCSPNYSDASTQPPGYSGSAAVVGTAPASQVR